MTVRTTARRSAAALALATAFTAGGGAAFADQIANTLDTTVDAQAEVMALNIDGSATTSFTVTPTNGDGKNGCNLTGRTTMTARITVQGTAVRVNESNVTFDSCSSAPTITVRGVAQGQSRISLDLVSNNTGGAFDLGPATFTVNVVAPAPANVAPKVAVTGVDKGTYELGVDTLPTPGCAVTDAEDGPSTPQPVIVDSRDVHGVGSVEVTCSYTDQGGLTAVSSSSYAVVDTIAPTIELVNRDPQPNAHGWNNSAVSATWQCSDGGSGVVDATVTGSVTGEGADQVITGTCSDNAGNISSNVISGVNIDLTAPSVALAGAISDGSSYYFGSVPAAPTCGASDALSGLDGDCTVSGYAATVGSHTVTAAVNDLAGNHAAASATYNVLAWKLTGYYQPVDMNGTLNVVKNGSTVPLKFEAFAGSEINDVNTLGAKFSVTPITCATGVASDDVELTTTGGTSLRYDFTAGQFIQNWQTPKAPGSCYRVTTTTADGSQLSAMFKLK